MNKKREEFKQKAKKIEKTIISIGLSVFLLGVLISIVQYGIKKSQSKEEQQNSSSGDCIINIDDNSVIYENNLSFNLTIGNFSTENQYFVVIKINDEIIQENYVRSEKNTFDIFFSSEGKERINVIVYKDNNEYATLERNIFYIEPYQSQFLDELSNKGVTCHYKDGTWEKFSKSSKQNESLGTQYLRIEFVWNVIDKNDGTYDFSGYDSYLTEGSKKIIGIINEKKAGTLAGEDLKINTNEELEQFVKFVGEVARKYPYIKYYQILNEPNFSTSNVAYMNVEEIEWYTKVIKRTYEELKKIDSDIKIIAGATAVSLNDGDTYISSENFFKQINSRIYSYSDGYAYHPYDIYNNKVQNQLFNTKISLHNNLFNDFGGFIREYITEYGIPSHNTYNVTEEIQANKLIQQSVILDRQKVEFAIIYNFWNIGKDLSNKEHNFGLLYNNYTPKPSYYSIKNYLTNTNGSEYIGTLSIQEGLEAHVYNKDGKPLIIAWSNNTDNTYNFTLNETTAKDLYGKDITPDQSNQIQITTSPVYIYNADTSYFYQAIANTTLTKYNEFTEKFASQIQQNPSLQSSIENLKQKIQQTSTISTLDETTAMNLMKEHYNLGDTLIQAYKSGTLQIEYVTLSSMLDMLDDIGDSFEDLVTVSAKTREANLTETLNAITVAQTKIQGDEIDIIYPAKILEFAQDFYDTANYINSLEEENDIKTGLIVSKNLHSKLLADWASKFADLYIDEYIENNPVTIEYSETELTNKQVTATLQTNANITVTNNENSKTYTFNQNGTFTFEYTIKGREFKQVATVNNIDMVAPEITNIQNDKLYLTEVAPKIQDENLKEVTLYKDGKIVENYQANSKISEEGYYKLIAIDKATNKTEVEFYIFKNPASVTYSTTEWTNQDVIATIVSNFEVEVINNNNNISYTFTKNEEFEFKLKIKGTEISLKAKVNNIDKTHPKITGIEQGGIYLTKATPVITDENLQEIQLYCNDELVDNYTSGTELSEEGFYKIIATDKAQNQTTIEFVITGKIDTEYKMTENYILNIENHTNIDEFKQKLSIANQYEIQRNGEAISKDEIIATGDILKLQSGEEYTLIVNGDVNKDGEVNIKDVVSLRIYLVERNNLDDLELMAADCNLDGKPINIKDLVRMRIIVLQRDLT